MIESIASISSHGATGHPHLIKWRRMGRQYDLSSLRLLGSSASGIIPSLDWYHRKIGGERCPIVDRGADRDGRDHDVAVARRRGDQARQLHQAPARRRAEIVGEDRKPVPVGSGGWLTIAKPWPAMLRGIWGDDERYKAQYWSDVPGRYLCGDNARCDEDGYYWIMGRIDDVLNVSGHRLSTIEIESALVSHEAVAEAAAVGRPHDIKGESVTVFVTLSSGFDPSEELRKALKNHVRKEIGALPCPTTSTSPQHCPRPAAARSCGACSATSPPAARPWATPRRWKITACWLGCERKTSKNGYVPFSP